MTYKIALTRKKYRQCLIVTVNGITSYVVKNSDDEYHVFDSCNTIEPSEPFDAAPFIEAYNDHIQRIAAKKQADLEIAQEAERKRIADLTERIKGCETPKELANEFGFTTVDIASHWSDLYEGRSYYGVIIGGKDEAEIMEMAISIHNIDGEYGEARNRAGEQHNTFSGGIYDLKHYQEGLKRHFNGDHYFYRSQETEQEFTLEEIEKAAADRDMDKVKALMQSFDEIEDGYYDCNGNLEILEKDLNSDNITGYSEDVYTYSFAYRFWHKNSFEEVTEVTDDKE